MDRDPLFAIGDCIRRRSGGPEHVIRDVGEAAYYFRDGTFALVEDQDCYVVVRKASGFFRVAADLYGAPLGEYLQNGYETKADFAAALRRLVGRWGGRVGESVGRRHDHLLLRFHDTPGSRPDEAWLPLYLLAPATDEQAAASRPEPEARDEITESLDRAFGFD